MIDVLVVDDEPIVAEAHATYVDRLEEFRVVGVAHSCREAARCLAHRPVDLVLLDIRLPDGSGAELLRRMRADHVLCDVVVVTSVRDMHLVRRCMSLGVVDYLLKPFTFDTFRAKLQHYAVYHRRLAHTDHVAQAEVDRLFATLHHRDVDGLPEGDVDGLPKGMDDITLHRITGHLRTAPDGRSAREVADTAGISRVTARRYLEHLSDIGSCRRGKRYGRSGRPEIEYTWIPAPAEPCEGTEERLTDC